jgi:hypothetical protein
MPCHAIPNPPILPTQNATQCSNHAISFPFLPLFSPSFLFLPSNVPLPFLSLLHIVNRCQLPNFPSCLPLHQPSFNPDIFPDAASLPALMISGVAVIGHSS